MPDPAYAVSALNHPFKPLVLSILVPGAAIQRPEIPLELVILISKLATTFLLKAKVKYCVPVSPLLFGPTGKYPLE